MNENLSPHQFTPDQVDVLRATDFPGSIGDQAARKRFNDSALQGERVLRKHREAGGPLNYLDNLTQSIREAGRIETPVVVEEHEDGDYFSVVDGHHRALAARELGLPLPYLKR